MRTENLFYRHADIEMKGFIAYDEKSKMRRPAVIVAPAWRGLDQFARDKAMALAELGYVGFVADLYGEGKCVGNEEAPEMMAPLFLDRVLLQKRIIAAFEVVQTHSLVDREKIGAIGFCFGGLTVIELFRSGAPVKGVVSFHAVLGNELDGRRAKVVPIAKGIKGSLLILHGHDDSLVTSSHIASIQKELTEAKVDWQMHIYGKTMHAFTNPEAQNPKTGVQFHPISAARSWLSMQNFFTEVFEERD
ncbi:MAG: dienelactone hydrolase family protein [Chlamydiae bacterium]|nr:dienelactone hydrolase family protein [Chlamydiota bacterium]